MLKGIPNLLSPELLKILMEMGHGDRIVIGDGNFPHASIAGSGHLVRLDGDTIRRARRCIDEMIRLG